MPITAGGGVNSEIGFIKLLESGADKVAINTYALQENSNIINDLAKRFGSQAVIVNVEAKLVGNDWFCYTDNGRIPTNKKVIDWVKEAEERGAGEILIQSIDRDGSKKGFDKSLVGEVVVNTNIPVIASSGAGSIQDIKDLVKTSNPSAVALSSILHYELTSIDKIKSSL